MEKPREKLSVPVDMLRNKQGQIADVRVLRFGKSLLYVPTSWFTKTAYSEKWANGGKSPDAIDPLLESDEDPGIVHDVIPGGRLNLYSKMAHQDGELASDFPVGRFQLKHWDSAVSKELYKARDEFGDPDVLGWARLGQGTYFIDMESVGRGGPPNGVTSPALASHIDGHFRSNLSNSSSVQQRPVVMEYFWSDERAPQPTWRDLRERMQRLLEWLATPPSDRTASQTL